MPIIHDPVSDSDFGWISAFVIFGSATAVDGIAAGETGATGSWAHPDKQDIPATRSKPLRIAYPFLFMFFLSWRGHVLLFPLQHKQFVVRVLDVNDPKTNEEKSRLQRRVKRSIAWFVLIAVGIAGAAFWKIETRAVCPVPILMYHKIGDNQDSVWWVTVSDFDHQLQSLREQGYQTVLPSDLAANRRWGKPLPPKPIILTFDDGYLNCMENAEPLLKKYGFQGICYLITGQISESPDTRRTYEGAPILSWPEVQAMQKRGTVTFGGHTRHHVNLRAAEDTYPEARDCYMDIRDLGGFKPAGFCYPFGEYREKTGPAAVARAGFTTAVTCKDGIAETGPTLKLMELPRVSVIGGVHRYHVEILPTHSAGTFAVRVWKEGHTMKVYPRWVWPGQDANAGWSDHVLITDQPVTLTWTLPSPSPTKAPILELWDDFRVLRLFQTSL